MAFQLRNTFKNLLMNNVHILMLLMTTMETSKECLKAKPKVN